MTQQNGEGNSSLCNNFLGIAPNVSILALRRLFSVIFIPKGGLVGGEEGNGLGVRGATSGSERTGSATDVARLSNHL